MSRYSTVKAVGAGSDTVDLFPGGLLADAVFVTVTGNLTLVMQDGTELAIASAGANTLWPFAAKRVKATGLTATVYACRYQ